MSRFKAFIRQKIKYVAQNEKSNFGFSYTGQILKHFIGPSSSINLLFLNSYIISIIFFLPDRVAFFFWLRDVIHVESLEKDAVGSKKRVSSFSVLET